MAKFWDLMAEQLKIMNDVEPMYSEVFHPA